MSLSERQHRNNQLGGQWFAVVGMGFTIVCMAIVALNWKMDFYFIAIGLGLVAVGFVFSVWFFRFSKREGRRADERRILARYEPAIQAFVGQYWSTPARKAKMIHDLEFWIMQAIKRGYAVDGKDVVMAIAVLNVIRPLLSEDRAYLEDKTKAAQWAASYFKTRSYSEYMAIFVRGEDE